jgi:tripartite-type tricarboxylate transporter receptor subunit TctC
MRRRHLIALGAGLTLAKPALAFPDRALRLIVPYGPGGITDIAARIIAPRIGEELGQPMPVDNRPGGAAMLGFGMAARAPADGHTLVLATTALAANPVLFRTIPYDARTDFTPISLTGVVPMVLVVPANSPARTLQDFVAMAKARPLNYGSAGNGSGNHLATEMFSHAAGISATHVPYRGGGQVMTDLVAARVDFVFAVLPTARPFILSGDLRALAVTGPRRSSAVPDVPTVAEALIPGFSLHEWLGLFGPAGIPAPIQARLNAATLAALRRPETAQRLAEIGVEVAGTTPAELARFLDAELTRWADLAKVVRFEVAD